MKWGTRIVLVMLLAGLFVSVSGDILADEAVVEVVVDIGVCGDGIVGSSEDCDGDNLNGRTCRSEGFVAGILSCTVACDFDTSRCVPSNNSNSGSSGNVDSSGTGSTTSENNNNNLEDDEGLTTSPLPSIVGSQGIDRARTVSASVEDYTQLPFVFWGGAGDSASEQIEGVQELYQADQDSYNESGVDFDQGSQSGESGVENRVVQIVDTTNRVIGRVAGVIFVKPAQVITGTAKVVTKTVIGVIKNNLEVTQNIVVSFFRTVRETMRAFFRTG